MHQDGHRRILSAYMRQEQWCIVFYVLWILARGFISHATAFRNQDPILGMKTGFALHHGHLDLGKIAPKRLLAGKFAFLSACNEASGVNELPGEALHLSGFNSLDFQLSSPPYGLLAMRMPPK